jgi:hypothetical protein
VSDGAATLRYGALAGQYWELKAQPFSLSIRMKAAGTALGISIHTGWGAGVLVAGTPAKPMVLANERIEILGDDERFCFHMAAEMKRPAAEKWLAQLRKKAVANARRAIAPFTARARACALVAKPGEPGPLDEVLAAHPRIHTAEGCFYRDVLAEACPIPVTIVPPKTLDPARIGKIAPPPWGKDQRLAALAAWNVLGRSG